MADEQQISSEVPRGATVRSLYAEREVAVYGVFESEIKSISLFNTLSTVAFSLASAFLSFAGAIWINASFTETLTPEAKIMLHVAAPILCVLAFIAACMGGWALYSRGSALAAIKKQSKTLG